MLRVRLRQQDRAEIVGNLASDARATVLAFIGIMGRRAGHRPWKCALRDRPNVALLGEEVAEKKLALWRMSRRTSPSSCARGMSAGSTTAWCSCRKVCCRSRPILQLAEERAREKKAGEKGTVRRGRRATCPRDFEQALALARDAHGNPNLGALSRRRSSSPSSSPSAACPPTPLKRSARRSTSAGTAKGRPGCPPTSTRRTRTTWDTARVFSPPGRWRRGCGGGEPRRPRRVLARRRRTSAAHAAAPAREERTAWWCVRRLVDLKGPAFASFAEKRDAWRLEDRFRPEHGVRRRRRRRRPSDHTRLAEEAAESARKRSARTLARRDERRRAWVTRDEERGAVAVNRRLSRRGVRQRDADARLETCCLNCRRGRRDAPSPPFAARGASAVRKKKKKKPPRGRVPTPVPQAATDYCSSLSRPSPLLAEPSCPPPLPRAARHGFRLAASPPRLA